MWGGTRAVLSLLLLVNAVVARDYVHQQDANYSSQPRSSSKGQSRPHKGKKQDPYNERHDLDMRGEGLRNSQLRTIQQEAEAAEVTAVFTADDFANAVARGVPHIVIRDHLDLTTIQPQLGGAPVLYDMAVYSETPTVGRSIRGNCSEIRNLPILVDSNNATIKPLPLRSRVEQCVIEVDLPFLNVQNHLWLSGLYISHKSSERSENAPTIACSSQNCRLWMNDVRFQGDYSVRTAAVAMSVNDAQVYADGLIVADFNTTFSAITISGASTVTVTNCEFLKNTISMESRDAALIYLQGNGNILRISTCLMLANSGPNTFFVDIATFEEETVLRRTQFNDTAPLPRSAATRGRTLSQQAVSPDRVVRLQSFLTRGLETPWHPQNDRVALRYSSSTARCGLSQNGFPVRALLQQVAQWNSQQSVPEKVPSGNVPSEKVPSLEQPANTAARTLAQQLPAGPTVAIGPGETQIFSDEPRYFGSTLTGNVTATSPLLEAPQFRPGLGPSDLWLLNVRTQSLFGREVDVTESAPLGEDSTALDSDSNGNSQRAVGLYVGLGILIAFVCGGAPVLSWWCCKAACVRRTQDINRFNSTDPTETTTVDLSGTATNLVGSARYVPDTDQVLMNNRAANLTRISSHTQSFWRRVLSTVSIHTGRSQITTNELTAPQGPENAHSDPVLKRNINRDGSRPFSQPLRSVRERNTVPNELYSHLKSRLGYAPAPGETSPQPKLQSQYKTAEQDTFMLTHSVLDGGMPPPAPNASQQEKVDFLLQQLDTFGTQNPALGELVLLGGRSSNRMQGGQAVVQMAEHRTTRVEYAIKFFISRNAFTRELDLYSDNSDDASQQLYKFLPQVIHVYDNLDESIQDPSGHPLPPCIVMERGESLDKWALRAKPDRFQAATVMSQVAVRVRDLHALGYVHRDLKPGNVMWLPRENRWTIIDFGCVAKAGSSAKMGFSFAYAAPEVIHAYRRGDPTVLVEEAADAWSLGVLAFELLTGKPALPMVHGREEVMDRIEGLKGLQLPWEEGSLSREHKRQLGVWRECIESLLQRDPLDRVSMDEFCDACNRVLSASSTVYTAD